MHLEERAAAVVGVQVAVAGAAVARDTCVRHGPCALIVMRAWTLHRQCIRFAVAVAGVQVAVAREAGARGAGLGGTPYILVVAVLLVPAVITRTADAQVTRAICKLRALGMIKNDIAPARVRVPL